jgi:hypothetical protein
MSTHAPLPQVCLLAGSLLTACNPQGLQGSLSTVLSLNYTNADLTIAANQASLRFLRPVAATDIPPDAGALSDDVVLKVTTNLTGAQVVPAKGCKVDTDCPTSTVCIMALCAFDLSEVLPTGGQRGVLTRNVLNDPVQTFPLIQRGEFYVTGTPQTGHSVSGYFTVTFQEGIDEASGRTVYAGFNAKVL